MLTHAFTKFCLFFAICLIIWQPNNAVYQSIAVAKTHTSIESTEQCPQFPPGPVPDPAFLNTDVTVRFVVPAEEFLDYLNTYGANALVTQYKLTKGKNWNGELQKYQDFTGDGIPELAVRWGRFYIFGCDNGTYVLLYQIQPMGAWSFTPKIVDTIDANQNDIPEIALLTSFLTQGGHYYRVIEWDGEKFQSKLVPSVYGKLLDEADIFVEAKGKLSIEDVDGDGQIEYVANKGLPVWETYQLGVPWRYEKQYYKWDGENFVFYRRTFSPPVYRFQAVQDGDRATMQGDYALALQFYQQAIFDQHLVGWSEERRFFIANDFIFNHQRHHDHPPEAEMPPPDPLEYDHIAAYAQYHMMIIQLKRD